MTDPAAQFPITLKALVVPEGVRTFSRGDRDRFIGAVVALERYEAEGVVLKVEHATLKGNLNAGFATAWEVLVHEPFLYAGRFRDRTAAETKLENSLNRPECHTAAGYLKKVRAATAADGPMRTAMLSLLEEIAPLAARASALKDLIGKRAPAQTKTSVEQAERDAKAMTCQCCGRAILAETGVIAHHGYTRPTEGWQTASCTGARHLPFEVDRSELGNEIERALNHRAILAASREATAAETTPLSRAWEETVQDPRRARGFGLSTPRRVTDITRENFDAKVAETPAAFAGAHGPYDREKHRYTPFTFDVMLAQALGRLDSQITQMGAYIVQQQARFDGWKPDTQKAFAWNALRQKVPG